MKLIGISDESCVLAWSPQLNENVAILKRQKKTKQHAANHEKTPIKLLIFFLQSWSHLTFAGVLTDYKYKSHWHFSHVLLPALHFLQHFHNLASTSLNHYFDFLSTFQTHYILCSICAKLCCLPHHPIEGRAQVALRLFFSLTRRSSSCYLGEGVPIIYSLHSPGARLTRWVSDWGLRQLLALLLKGPQPQTHVHFGLKRLSQRQQRQQCLAYSFQESDWESVWMKMPSWRCKTSRG